jgi:hypothetical protein
MRSLAFAFLYLVACDSDGGRWPGDRPGQLDAATGAAPDATAEPGSDASAVCGGWRQVWPTLQSAELLETRPVHSDRSARVRIEHDECPGDVAGAWSVGFTLENEFAVITPTLWRSGPDCEQPDLRSRVVTVKFLYPGSWKIGTASGSLSVPVGAPPDGACGAAPPGACQRDCDCPTSEVCLSGDDVQRCAAPCEYDRDCGGEGRCGSAGGLTSICRRALAECGADRPCPDGYACASGSCEPSFQLNQASRHACECDADCEPGLRCVAHFVGGDDCTFKQCEVICQSPSDAWCEGAHSCNPAAVVDYADGVCGWVGE